MLPHILHSNLSTIYNYSFEHKIIFVVHIETQIYNTHYSEITFASYFKGRILILWQPCKISKRSDDWVEVMDKQVLLRFGVQTVSPWRHDTENLFTIRRRWK